MAIRAVTALSRQDISTSDCIFRKVSLRLLPFLFLLYVINLIDRTNIGIARLQMVDEQRILDEQAYSLGAGIFYIGYLLFEVPSNLILARIGARVWIARIMVSWGLISSAMMFVTGPWSFAILRILLGVAEAGFFPGIIYYLNDWFPTSVRARAIAKFMTGGVIASLIGNPISAYILQYMDRVGGLWGWQWVFLLEGIPAAIVGVIVLFYLTDQPHQARWLSPEERAWLVERIEKDRIQPQRRSESLLAAFFDRRVWLLIAVYFSAAVCDNSYGFYIPTFLRSQFPSWEKHEIGLLAAVPSVFALAGMILVGRHSDRTGERRGHAAGAAFTAALGWLTIAAVASGWLPIAIEVSRWVFVLGVTIALTGMKSLLPIFWTLPPVFLTGAAAAGGIALINSIANLGGMLGPWLVGQVKTATGGFGGGYLFMAATMLIGGMLVLNARVRQQGDG